MNTDKDNLERLEPEEAQQLFLDHKGTNCTDATVRNYRHRINHFVEWCENQGIDNLNDLSGRDIQRFRLARKETGDVKNITLRVQMSTLRVFLNWAGTIEAVPENLYTKVMVPRVPIEEQQRDETLEAETAQDILDYLMTYHYGSLEHALFSLLWESGMRLGGANSIDLEDVNFETSRIQLRHRSSQGTTLKNGQRGERLVAMTPELSSLLEDHIEDRRYDVTDEYGRVPLFTTQRGRMARTSIRRTIYRITSPCYRGETCPGCKEKPDKKCPEAVSPHSIRRGSITHFLSNDVPVEIVSDRMDVSRKILDKHYDKRSDEVKLEQRRGYLNNI